MECLVKSRLKLCLLTCLMVGVCGLNAAQAINPKHYEAGIGKRIVQRMSSFFSKHVDLKKPAVLAMAVWLLNGAPAQAEHPDLNISTEHAVRQPTGGGTLANIHADWEFLKPIRGDKDFTQSFNYLVIEAGDFWRIMHLVYLGKSNDEHLFIGPRAFIRMGDGLIIDQTINSLVGRNGLIKENIVEITERRHIVHPVRKLFDTTILSIKDVDMTDHEPIVTAAYPNEGAELEMYSYLVTLENINNIKGYQLSKRACKAGSIDPNHGYGYNNCLIVPSPAVIGSPVVDKYNRLVGLYSGQEHLGENHIMTAFSTLVPLKLRDLEIEGYAVEASAKLATTWAQIKSQKQK